jgi:hypothetical protein
MRIFEVVSLDESITRVTLDTGEKKHIRTYGKMSHDEIINYYRRLGKKVVCIDNDCDLDVKEVAPAAAALGHAILRQLGKSIATASGIAYAPGTNKDQSKKQDKEEQKVKDESI